MRAGGAGWGLMTGVRFGNIVREGEKMMGNYCPVLRACEPQLLSLRATTTEARAPRPRDPQQEKPPS